MTDIILNEALGISRPIIQQVENNSPVAAVLRLHLWDTTGVSEEDIRDVTDGNVDDYEAVANIAEITNTGYSNLALDETDITITVDDSNDSVDIGIADQVFTSISAGDAITKLTVSYDGDGTDTDTGTVVLWSLDFVVTANGGDITADFAAVSWRVSQG